MCKSNISSGKRPLEGDKIKKGQGHSVVDCCLEVVKLKTIHTCAEMNLERISKMGVIYNFNFWMRSHAKKQIVKIILIKQKQY